MIFNSLQFAVFLPLVFLIYWFVLKNQLRLQNLFLLIASFIFYGWWDYRFLGLIAASILLDFFIGIQLDKSKEKKKRLFYLSLSILVNLGLLGFFKYYNFFITSFIDAFSFLGFRLHVQTLQIILPVGISFYTFQTLSYSIDIYRKQLSPTRDFIAFAAFVSFFPQLVAGPIERAKNLLPQFFVSRTFNYQKSVEGMRQILWGLFKKIVVADNCAEHANFIFENNTDLNGSSLALGAVFFAFQIYGDFSGYSDIALGTARLLGFNLMKNFNYPYFSRDIAEFWRRWHISLSTFFRDYLYIPLGGNLGGKWKVVRNILLVFLISGFWHGANWTFIAWGFFHGLLFLPLILFSAHRRNLDTVATATIYPNGREIFQMLTTFTLVLIGWIFFRADSISFALDFFTGLPRNFFAVPNYYGFKSSIITMFWIGILVVIEWFSRDHDFALQKLFLNNSRPLRWSIYLALLAAIFWYRDKEVAFIYFQF